MAEAASREQDALEIVRHYPAPIERVWQAWTDPKALSRWFGPGDEGCVTQADMDVRPGGRYTLAFRTADGEEHRVSGEYEEVSAPHVVSFTWFWQSTPERVSFVRVALKTEGNGTRMAFRHERFFDRAAVEAHTRGWTAAIAKLDRLMGGVS